MKGNGNDAEQLGRPCFASSAGGLLRGAGGAGAAGEAGCRHLLPAAQGRRQGRAAGALPHRSDAATRGAHEPVVFDADLRPQARSPVRAADHREGHTGRPGIRAAFEGSRHQRAPGRGDPLPAPRPPGDFARGLRAGQGQAGGGRRLVDRHLFRQRCRRHAHHGGPRPPLCLDAAHARRPAPAPAGSRPAPARAGRRPRAGAEGGWQDLRALRPHGREVGSGVTHRMAGAFARRRRLRLGGRAARRPSCHAGALHAARLRLHPADARGMALRRSREPGRDHLQGHHPRDGRPRQRPPAGPVPAPVVQERLGRRQARAHLRHGARPAAPAGRLGVQDQHHLQRLRAVLARHHRIAAAGRAEGRDAQGHGHRRPRTAGAR